MPLWDGYDEMLKSDIADLANAADSPMAGCITAALFLRRFVPEGDRLGASRHLRLARRRPSRGGPRAATRWACGRFSPCSRSATAPESLARQPPNISHFGRSLLQHFRPCRFILTATRRWETESANGRGFAIGLDAALIAYVRSGEPDLTNRQMALLMLVYLTPGPHTVRGLARCSAFPSRSSRAP
jgi:hypothetical protein